MTSKSDDLHQHECASDLRESVARAIATSYGLDPDDIAPRSVICGPGNEHLQEWEAYEEQASAALRAASERDAAVREVERLRAGLRELAEPPGPHADEIAWNMAERAKQILASAAQKQAKPALTIEDSSGGANG